MSYPVLPGRAIPYHDDGTVVKLLKVSDGIVYTFSHDEMSALNDTEPDVVMDYLCYDYVVFFFPEKRHLRAVFAYVQVKSSAAEWYSPAKIEGSNDTTNGYDGTWVEATPDTSWGTLDGEWQRNIPFDAWRYPSSGTFPDDGTFRVWRFQNQRPNNCTAPTIIHLYGHKAAGETPDDLLWVDPATGEERTSAIDFGAVPAGTSSIATLALQNVSDSKMAQNITVSVEDPEDIVRIGWSDTGPWEVSLSIDSLAAGAVSDTIYIKAEAPAPPTPLRPWRAPVVATVGAWS